MSSLRGALPPQPYQATLLPRAASTMASQSEASMPKALEGAIAPDVATSAVAPASCTNERRESLEESMCRSFRLERCGLKKRTGNVRV